MQSMLKLFRVSTTPLESRLRYVFSFDRIVLALLFMKWKPTNHNQYPSPQNDSDCLGRIHTGRSLASFKLEQLSESYKDCVMAMDKLPQSLTVHRVKVLERMVCCKPEMAKGILKKIR